jgi:hypothetical protein
VRRGVGGLTIFLTAGVGLLLSVGLAGNAGSARRGAQGALTITVTPTEPSQTVIDNAVEEVLHIPQVQEQLAGTRYRQLSFELVNDLSGGRLKSLKTNPFRVVFFDYTNNRPVVVEGELNQPSGARMTLPQHQPLPSRAEFDAAVELLRQHPNFGPLLRDGRLAAYPPMPPLVAEDAGTGGERTLAVGLRSSTAALASQIVGVNMIRQTVITFPRAAPPTAQSTQGACGAPNAGQSTTTRGTAGQYEVVINQSGMEIWRFLALRPSISSGRRASGVEMRDVRYRGKLVLRRAHAPILNVKYADDACGPFRDWQWEEDSFVANGTDVAPGFRSCPAPAQTLIENGTDTGNFRGVAVYTEGDEVVLVSELQAGWYRYISQWRLHTNGTIRPRFGFDGVSNSCVCNTHNHHVYWRLDFDLATAGKNRFYELLTRSFVTPQLTEVKRNRDYVRNRRWMVQNTATGESYLILPGAEDGVADAYARGDVWLLRYRSTELDDGHNSTGSATEADLDQFVNGESLDEEDVVMWYAAHFYHVESGGAHGHYVGPDLVVTRW